jgi:hypothetical protein
MNKIIHKVNLHNHSVIAIWHLVKFEQIVEKFQSALPLIFQ